MLKIKILKDYEPKPWTTSSISSLRSPMIESPLIKISERNLHRKRQNFNHLCNSTLTTNMDKQ